MATALPATPLPLMAILDEGVRHFRRHFRQVYVPVCVPVALVSGLLPLAQGLMFAGMPGGTPPADPFAALSGMIVFIVASLAIGVVYAIGQIAAMVGAMDGIGGRPISPSRCWRFPVGADALGTMLLTWLILVPAFCLCILPGVYGSLLLAFVVPVMVEEGVFGTAALRRSSDLARHNPQRDVTSDPRTKVFVIMVVSFLLAYVVGLVVQLPLIVVQQVVMIRSAASGTRMDPSALMWTMLWLSVPTAILGGLARLAVGLYASFCTGLLFLDVRRRKEGGDLEGAIASLGAAPALPQ
jgi:hypothetical protein